MSEQDRAASLPLGEVVDLVGHLAATGASLRRLISGSATGPTAREPAAPSAPRNAAAEAPAVSRCEHGVDRSRVHCPPCGPSDAPQTSPLATRVLTALMDMPDAEFLVLANKVIGRYHAAIAALAPDGVAPHVPQVECIHCNKVQTHRVCAECFPKDYDG
jgi:hypothetical protein